MPMLLLEPRLGTLTQGAIFTCAAAERYKAAAVYGLVITARCDIAQEKYPVLSYVPVVSLKNWLEKDGAEIIFHRAYSDLKARMLSIFKNSGISESVLYAQRPRDILNSFFLKPQLNKQERAAFERFEVVVEGLELLETIEAGYSENMKKFFEVFRKIKESVIKEVVNQKISGYYFIPKVFKDEDPTGYIAILREVFSIPRPLAVQLANGMDRLSPLFSSHPEAKSYFSFIHSDFAMPISVVPSPYIEHIMQCFSMMFVRIGVEDLDQKYVNDLCTLEP